MLKSWHCRHKHLEIKTQTCRVDRDMLVFFLEQPFHFLLLLTFKWITSVSKPQTTTNVCIKKPAVKNSLSWIIEHVTTYLELIWGSRNKLQITTTIKGLSLKPNSDPTNSSEISF